MKKIIILSGILLLSATSAYAGIFSNIFGFNNYNRGYYPPYNYRYTNSSYYRPPRYNNYYNNMYNYNRSPYGYNYNNRYYNRYPGNYYRRPVILRTNVRRSQNNSCEKVVANQISGLEKLENKILLQTYEYDNPKSRIERLEQRVFGAAQSGELPERLNNLKTAAKNYKSYNAGAYNTYDQGFSAENSYRPPIFTGSSGAGWRNTLWGNFRNQFVGMPTGITPGMDPAYMDYFEAERALMGNGDSVDIRTNRGYHRSNTNRGMTTGVTILD